MLLKNEVFLGPKGSALGYLYHPDLLFRQVQNLGQLGAVVENALRAHLYGDATIVIGEGDARLWLQKGMLNEGRSEGALSDDGTLRKRGLHIATLDLGMVQQVAFLMDFGRIGSGCLLRREDPGQYPVVDPNLLHRGFGDFPSLSKDRGYRIAPVAHLVASDRWLVADDITTLVLAGHILGGQDQRHPLHRLRLPRVYAQNFGVGVSCPQDLAVQHPLHRDVRAIASCAGHLGHRVANGHRHPGLTFGWHSQSGSRTGCQLLRCRLNRRDNGHVAGAATQVAVLGKRLLDFVSRGVGIGIQQHSCRHDHAGRAEATLSRPMLDEGFLNRMQVPVLGQAFDRLHLGTLNFRHTGQAGTGCLTIHDNRARPAVPGGTAILGTCQTHVVTQEAHQAQVRGHQSAHILTVDRQLDIDRICHFLSLVLRPYSMPASGLRAISAIFAWSTSLPWLMTRAGAA